MKIKSYHAYTTPSLTAAIEMHKVLVRRMKGGESLDLEGEPGLQIKINEVFLRTYDHSGSCMHTVTVCGPIGLTAKVLSVDDAAAIAQGFKEGIEVDDSHTRDAINIMLNQRK